MTGRVGPMFFTGVTNICAFDVCETLANLVLGDVVLLGELLSNSWRYHEGHDSRAYAGGTDLYIQEQYVTIRVVSQYVV